jgi:hypothetical protein
MLSIQNTLASAGMKCFFIQRFRNFRSEMVSVWIENIPVLIFSAVRRSFTTWRASEAASCIPDSGNCYDVINLVVNLIIRMMIIAIIVMVMTMMMTKMKMIMMIT